MNLYTYVANNPLKYTDQNGLTKVLIFTAIPKSDRDKQLIETTYWYQRRILMESGIKGDNIIRIPDAMTPKTVNAGAKPYLGDIKQEIFIMHGIENEFNIGSINRDNISQLNKIKVDKNDNPSILLITCWAGHGGDKSIAQNLSNTLDVNVTAADDGRVWVNEGVEDDIPGHPIGEPFPEIGNWKTFTPFN